jgi:hypothetical protein
VSVVLATTQPWPEVETALDSLRDQVVDTGAEVVLGHRGDGFPDDVAGRYPGVRPVVRPGGSASELRGAALETTTGDIVAITEDHCVVAADWIEAVLRAHREHPEAAAIGGAVENGATDTVMDWAAYFVGNAFAMAPLREEDGLPGQANVTYKRWALPETLPPSGFHELEHNLVLAARGAETRVDDRMVVWHDQSLGFRGTLAIHFNAARASAGSQAAEMTRARRLGRALVTPLRQVGAVSLRLRAPWRKRRLRARMLAVAPAILLVASSAGAGKCIGFLAGPGDSAGRIR